jgi:hypothetical protein
MLFDSPVSLTDALTHQLAKQVLPTGMSSTELASTLSPAIRERSFFSARTLQADYLSDAQRMIRQLVQIDVVAGPAGTLRPVQPGERLNPALVRTKMQTYLQSIGYAPEKGTAGGLQDLSSDRRVDLIIDTQTRMSAGYAKWQASQDADILELYPADEMYRQTETTKQRDWQSRWNQARADLAGSTSACRATSWDGPFIALKNDPIWTAISRFGSPYPPFDYRSGMWVRDADDTEAERLGVLDHAAPAPQTRALNQDLQTPVQNMEPDVLDQLMRGFGDLASIRDGILSLRSLLAGGAA